MRPAPLFTVIVLSFGPALFAAGPASGPASRPASRPASTPAEEPALTERQQSLLLQLADAEANIRALNAALTRTGYKVGAAYSRIDSNLTGSEMMDRKGGGPVGWREFYGSTAREYDRNTHWDRAPRQFQKLYDANSNQVARAREQVAALAQDQTTLLARRQKLEADQARLWATLAFERIKDREIADEPICRFKLRGAGDGPADARAEVVRPLVLFLRAADQGALNGLEMIKTDPAAGFADLDPRMNAAYAALRTSLADSLPAADLNDQDKARADGLKSLCKQLAEQCTVIADNSRNALDRDKAREDNSKLQFRGRLQESLARFSAGVAELDVRLGETASAWKVEPERGVPTPDVVRTKGTPVATGPQAPTLAAGGWVKLLDADHIGQWARPNGEGKGSVKPEPRGFVLVRDVKYIWGATQVENAILRAKVHKVSGQNLSLTLRQGKEGAYGAWFNGGGVFGIGKTTAAGYRTLITVTIKRPLGPVFVMEFSAIGDQLVLSAGGEEIARCRDGALKAGVVAIGAFKGESHFDEVELKVLEEGAPGRP